MFFPPFQIDWMNNQQKNDFIAGLHEAGQAVQCAIAPPLKIQVTDRVNRVAFMFDKDSGSKMDSSDFIVVYYQDCPEEPKGYKITGYVKYASLGIRDAAEELRLFHASVNRHLAAYPSHRLMGLVILTNLGLDATHIKTRTEKMFVDIPIINARSTEKDFKSTETPDCRINMFIRLLDEGLFPKK